MPAKSPRIRYAVVGLGYIAQVAVLPAFAHAKNAELAALVSGDPQKRKKLGRKYAVGRRITSEQMATINLAPRRFHGEWNYVIHPRNCKA